MMDQQLDKDGNLRYFHGRTYQYDAMTGAMTEVPNPFQDIIDFHGKFGLTFEGSPRHLPSDLEQFRVKFLAEELAEYITDDKIVQNRIINAAFQGTVIRPFDAPPTKEKQFDALIDLMYILIGTAYLHGFPMREGWRRVHAANMKKVRVTREVDSARGSIYDVIKPAGWVPPSLTDLV